ncbi:hypothetical protein [Streptomyces sp. NPDC021224]|uniref:hypothetical protein n=1 Tax=unclassified Streptomyces TaxID=2593676 RepID=UPI0037945EFD
MPSTTSYPAEPVLAPPSTLPAAKRQPEAPTDPLAVRGLSHPRELTLRGIPVMCSACGARRDWLLINQARDVWIRCRCAHQWLEPEITRADYEALISVPAGTSYPTTKVAMLALGFDGSFYGAYLA